VTGKKDERPGRIVTRHILASSYAAARFFILSNQGGLNDSQTFFRVRALRASGHSGTRGRSPGGTRKGFCRRACRLSYPDQKDLGNQRQLRHESEQKLFYSSFGGVLMAGANGRVGIGTTSPSAKLTIHSDSNSVNNFAIRVENSDGTMLLGARDSGLVHIGAIGEPSTTSHICYRPNSGFGYYLTGCSSAAEYVPTMDAGKGYPETADLVSIAPALKNPYGDSHGPFVVQKSDTPCDANLFGFIIKSESGADGVKLNDHYLPLAIFGYFPAKVTMESGVIHRGDAITSSSKAGYGMKAGGGCKIIGYALEDASVEGTIQVFAHLGESAAADVATFRAEMEQLRQENAALNARLTALEQALPAVRGSTISANADAR